MFPSTALYFGTKSVIVAARHATPDGILYEQDTAKLVGNSASEIGAALKQSLQSFSVRAKDLRGAKQSDSPAFLASECRSIRQFESQFRCISVSYLNAAGMIARAEHPIRGDEGYSISATFNPHLPDESVGRILLGLVERAQQIRT